MQIILWWEIIKSIFLILWPFWVLLLAVMAIMLFFDRIGLEIHNWHIHRKFKNGEKWRSNRDFLLRLRDMKPSEFESYIADLFSRLGYKANVVGGSHDGGIDVILKKNGIKNYVQCKRFINSKVAVGDVRDFYGALVDCLANGKAYFITTNKFTLEAEKFAEDKPIELIDGHKLIRYIRMAERGEEKQ